MKTPFSVSLAFAVLIGIPSTWVRADGLALPAVERSDAKILEGLFKRIEKGDLLREGGPRSDGPGSGGIGLVTKEGLCFLNDISFTAKAILNYGTQGLDECCQRLSGESQSARIVAIYVLHMAFEIPNEDLLKAQLPMAGIQGETPRDLNSAEIEKLKELFVPKIAAIRELEIKRAQQGGSGQTSTRPESDSEDGDKPQPDSEGRSR